MKRLLTAAALGLLLAAPSGAAWTANGSTLRWTAQRATADMNEVRDALLWRYESRVLDGLFATAARASITVTDVGGGNSELSISLPLAAGNTWVTAIAAARCPEADTTAKRRACVDLFIKQEIRETWQAWRNRTPPAEVPEL